MTMRVLPSGGHALSRGLQRMWRSLKRRLTPDSPITLPPRLATQLAAIEPSVSGKVRYYPCRVVLSDTNELDCVYFVEYDSYMALWGVHPLDDPEKHYVPLSSVVALSESPSRLPVQFANRLYAGPETGMGYYVFSLVFSGGYRQAYLTGNAIDFIQYPSGHGPGDVVDVLPDVGQRESQLGNLQYHWCLYRGQVDRVEHP
jgi:hypothetical protein